MTTASGWQTVLRVTAVLLTVSVSALALASQQQSQGTRCDCQQSQARWPGGDLGGLLLLAPCPPTWRPQLVLGYCRALPCWAAAAVLARCLGLPTPSTPSTTTTPSTASTTTTPSTASTTTTFTSATTIASTIPASTTSASTTTTSTFTTSATSTFASADSPTTSHPSPGAADRIGNSIAGSQSEVTPGAITAAGVSATGASVFGSSLTTSTASFAAEAASLAAAAGFPVTVTVASATTAGVTGFTEDAGTRSFWPCHTVLALVERCRSLHALHCPAFKVLSRAAHRACPKHHPTSVSLQHPSASLSTSSFTSTSTPSSPPVSQARSSLGLSDSEKGRKRMTEGVGEVEGVAEAGREITVDATKTKTLVVNNGSHSILVAIATCFTLVWCVAIGLMLMHRWYQYNARKASAAKLAAAEQRERASRSRTRRGARLRAPD